MSKTTTIEWFPFAEKRPDESACILVVSDNDDDPIKTEWIWLDGRLFDENYDDVKITAKMLWAYWPDPDTVKKR